MRYSQNGFSANNPTVIASYTVPGTNIRVALRSGDVSVILLELLKRYHKTVEPLRQSDTGGYAPRNIRGATVLSNHASGTAVDARWRDHPLGARGTYSPAQVRAIRAILSYMGGVVRWGGDYQSRKDEMHFEIVGNLTQVRTLANKIRRDNARPAEKPKPAAKPFELKRGSKGAAVKALQTGMNRVFPGYAATPLKVDGDFGPGTERAVKEFQGRVGIKQDGIVGPNTRNQLARYGVKL